jgi:signal transduction histidine kinase
VDIRLKQEGNSMIFIVRDNGCGIPPAAICNPLSIGLTGMRERALLLGGQVAIQSRPDTGTIIEVRLPFSKNRDYSEDMS